MPIILAFRRLLQKDPMFKATLGHLVRLSQKKKRRNLF
jgi:hypothetical protein